VGKPQLHPGNAASDNEGHYVPKGATGVMVRSLLRYLEEAGR
jgi:leucyl aminopeptidase